MSEQDIDLYATLGVSPRADSATLAQAYRAMLHRHHPDKGVEPSVEHTIAVVRAYAVLRQEATERPFSSPLNEVKTAGTFHCAGCDNAVYSSQTKFDSGTGWPSFWEAVDASVGTQTDYVLVYPRTEVHCAQCGGHLGHVFDDGPKPTGKRHCINGVAMRFEAGVS